FTDLSELYSKPENGGASKLSQVLNTYLGGIVHEILGHGGDILKFSGDAILVLFKANSSVSLPDAIHRAIDTAIIIQLSYGRYKTDVGVTLRIKIAISAGEVHFSLVGNDSFSHYVVAGPPVWKVKLAERIALAGDIIVTYYAWSYIHDNEYVWDSCADKMHLKIKGFTSYWRSTKRLNYTEVSYWDDQEEEDPLEQDDSIKIDSEMLAIRPRLKYVTPHVVTSSLQKFLIKPVLIAVENNEPLELLTEMRQIVTVFLNIVLKPRDVVELIKEIDSIFTTVCKIVESYEGIVNKLSLFDKDVMFLIIFGLRGLKHEMDSQIALHCACEIQETYAKNPSILSSSIGITTGIAYCGIVGHTVRREYSAIGVDVNKAARLMMAYPHKVTCDKSTFMMSKLDPAHFTLQDAIQLKGLHNVGPIYEFREFISERELLKPMVYNYPLVDRDQFIEIFQEMIEDGLMIAQQTVQCSRADFPPDQWIQNCLLIRGEGQMGKTRLINEFFYIALRNRHISSLCFSLSLKDSKKPFTAVSLCISRPLGFTETITTVTRQNRMKLYLREHKMEQHLSLLNEIIGTNFNETDVTARLSQTEKDAARKELFRFLCQKTFQNLWVLIIDDAEFMDDESFDLFDVIWEMPHIITVLTVGYQKRLSPVRVRVLDSPHVCQVKLPPIETLLHKAVACQFLNVNAIPLDLERQLHTISNGNPGWINTFLLCLRQSGILRVKRMGYCEAQTEGYVFCEASFLKRDSIKSSSTLRPSLSDWRLFESSFDIGDPMLYPGEETPSLFNKIVDVAYLTGTVDTKDYYTSRNLEAFHLMLYDSLSAFEQLVCKCAAFLGQKFLRASLMYTMATESEWDVAIAMKKLFDLQILSCAIGDFSEGFRFAQKNVNSSWLASGECACIALEIDRNCKDLPKYAVCGYSKFNSSEFHSTVYNLVTEEQKKQYHSNALEFIESETKKCNSCGAVPFKNLMSCEETYEVQVGCRTYHVGYSESIAWMQERSLEIVAENVHRIDADYLDAVVRYYTALFRCQTLRSKKVLSIELGKVVLHINDKLQHQSAEWDIIPILCELLLAHRRIAETVQTLWTLQKLILHQQNPTGHIWYYAICLDVLLDTSCCIESYRRCENFYFKNRESFLAQRDGFASARLFANLWLWCVRYGAWVAADNWLVLLREYFVLRSYDSTININTAIRIVEGMVLTLINHIEARNTGQIRRVRASIETLLGSVEQALSTNRNHVARFELMRIYYRQVVDPAAGNVRRELAAAAKRAHLRNDHLCHDHIQHTAKFWHRELTPALENFWLDHAAGSDRSDGASRSQSFAVGTSFGMSNEQLYDYASCILNHERIYPYSMPLPRARFR
uniref:Guanylate cyclase domain-containing protein n=1 Tax=Anopheles christyi TaxID=43041 RepID=A0A182KCB6_9DIPT